VGARACDAIEIKINDDLWNVDLLFDRDIDRTVDLDHDAPDLLRVEPECEQVIAK
jgi:hypothetical protein